MSDDHIERTRALLPERDIDGMIDNIDAALDYKADQHDVELNDESYELVRQYVFRIVVKADERPDEPDEDSIIDHPDTASVWFDRLYDEFSDPEGRQAQTGLGMAIGAGSSNNSPLRQITGDVLREKYDRA